MSTNNVLKFHAIWRWSPGKVLVIWPISNGMTLMQFYLINIRPKLHHQKWRKLCVTLLV